MWNEELRLGGASRGFYWYWPKRFGEEENHLCNVVQLGAGQQVGRRKLDYVRINQGTNGLGKAYDAENVCEDRGRCYVEGKGI